MLNELALFAGAGGGILGGQLLGWRTVCAVERDAFAAALLAQRQNDGLLDLFPIWSDITTFDGKPWRGIVDVVSGDFPCQDISVAGKGAGIEGKRSGLWAEMERVISEVRPRFVFVENSPALTLRGLGRVLGDLAALGYDAEWGVLGASDVGAPHKRERIWIVGYARSVGWVTGRHDHSEYDGAIFTANDKDTEVLADTEGERTGDVTKTTGRPVEKSTHLTTQVALAEGLIDRKTGRMFPTPRACMTGAVTPGRAKDKFNNLESVLAREMYPTPTSSMCTIQDFEQAKYHSSKRPEYKNCYPTPTVNDSKNSTLPPSQVNHDNLPGALLRSGEKPGGQLNPTWVEWLMGWHSGWTDLKPLEMDRCRNVRQRHGVD